jgi:rod shape-determining protein MreD
VKVVGAALALFLALALQTTLAFAVARDRAVVDLVLVVVVYAALVAGPIGGLLAGTVAGLAQDALGGGIVGVGGLAKSVAGFLSGVAGTQFIVANAGHRFVVFFAASLLNAGCFLGLYKLISPGAFGAPWSAVATQALANAIVGVSAFHVIEHAPEWWYRRRLRRVALRSRSRP